MIHFLIFLCFGLSCFSQLNKVEELEFAAIHVLADYPHTFDLSGIVKTKDKCYLISDKSWSHYAYEFRAEGDYFYLIDSVDLGINPKSDIESVDYCEGLGIFYTDEEANVAYYSNIEGKSQVIFNKNQLTNELNWGTNKGLEGFAVDCENQIAYMAKERDPRFIITYDLKNQEIIDLSNQDSDGDISDLKYENGFLYILERYENQVAKMDVNTKEIVSRVSYKNTCSHPNGKLYQNTKYGMAEALLLTPGYIWIGLDNNGLPFSKHAEETYGLTGNQPVIIGFKRPSGF